MKSSLIGALAITILSVLLIFSIFFYFLPKSLNVDAVSIGMNQHCGSYTKSGKLSTPCKCLGKWTKGKILSEDKNSNRAYCHGIIGIIFLP